MRGYRRKRGAPALYGIYAKPTGGVRGEICLPVVLHEVEGVREKALRRIRYAKRSKDIYTDLNQEMFPPAHDFFY